jgi:hypothetical protein
MVSLGSWTWKYTMHVVLDSTSTLLYSWNYARALHLESMTTWGLFAYDTCQHGALHSAPVGLHEGWASPKVQKDEYDGLGPTAQTLLEGLYDLYCILLPIENKCCY